MGFRIEFGRSERPKPHQLDLSDIEAGHRYIKNRQVIADVQRYLIPPHDPVPELPFLTDDARLLLAHEAGRIIVTKWSTAFGPTFEKMDEFHTGLTVGLTNLEDVVRVTTTQSMAINTLSQRLIEMTLQDHARQV